MPELTYCLELDAEELSALSQFLQEVSSITSGLYPVEEAIYAKVQLLMEGR